MKFTVPKYVGTIILLLVVGGIMVLALSGYLNSLLGSAMTPLLSTQRWFSTRYLAIYETLTQPKDMATLSQENAVLIDENSRLQAQVIQLQQQLNESQILYSLLDFARSRPENVYVACAVIGRDPSPFLQYVIIDHGSDDGLRKGMPVVTEQGLVGRIDAVMASAARVQLLNDAGSNINVKLRESKAEGMLKGSVAGDISVEMIPQDAILTDGDIVLTSGLGGNFPTDVLVGQITGIRKLETDLFQTATIQSAVDFANLKAVLVITNFRPVDITPLIPASNLP